MILRETLLNSLLKVTAEMWWTHKRPCWHASSCCWCVGLWKWSSWSSIYRGDTSLLRVWCSLVIQQPNFWDLLDALDGKKAKVSVRILCVCVCVPHLGHNLWPAPKVNHRVDWKGSCCTGEQCDTNTEKSILIPPHHTSCPAWSLNPVWPKHAHY